MRILFLLTQSLDSPGGGGRYLPLAKALVQRGHEVTMLALHHDYAGARDRVFTIDGVTVRYVGQMHVLKRDNQKQYFKPWQLPWIAGSGTLRLALAALRTPADAVHVCKTQPMNGIAAWVKHKLQGTPVYLDSDDYETLNNRFQSRWQQWIVAWLERWMPSFAAGITANTTFIAEQFIAHGYPAERVRVIPNRVERRRFAVLDQKDAPERLAELKQTLRIAPGDRPIVYVGSMSLVNHPVDLLLKAFAGLLEEVPRALLLLVGSGEDLDHLRELATDLGIADRVRFTGRVPLDLVPYYYRLGEFSVAPMRDTVVARSSLSIKLVESIAASVPCLTADIGDYARTVGAAGEAVRPGDPEAFREGMRSLLQDGAKLRAMQEAARRMHEAYGWEGMAEKFLSIYESRNDPTGQTAGSHNEA